MFYKGTSAALVVADITDPESIENAEQWKRLINENIANQAYVARMQLKDGNETLSSTATNTDENDLPMLLVLNKYDLVEDLISEGFELEEYM